MSIVEYFERNTRKVTKIVDETFFRLMEPTTDLDRQMPATSYADRSLLLLKMKHGKPTIASLIAEEQEVPIHRSRIELKEELMSNLKLAKQYVMKDADFEMMQKLKMYAQQSSTPTEVVRGIEEHFFGLAAGLIPSIYEKATMLTMKIMVAGQCIYTDPLTNAQTSLDYTDSTTTSLLPAALTAGARWNQSATANGLQNLEQHAEDFYNLFGYFPKEITMRRRNMRQLADQKSTKRAALVKRGAGQVNDDAVDNLYLEDAEVAELIKGRTKCTTVTINDSMYTEERADGSTIDSYYLPDDYYYFNEAGIERAFVPTAEKNFAPGVFQTTDILNKMPRRERVGALANFVPLCLDPRKIAARKVNP